MIIRNIPSKSKNVSRGNVYTIFYVKSLRLVEKFIQVSVSGPSGLEGPGRRIKR